MIDAIKVIFLRWKLKVQVIDFVPVSSADEPSDAPKQRSSSNFGERISSRCLLVIIILLTKEEDCWCSYSTAKLF